VEPSPDFEPRLQHRLFHVRDEEAGERASGASAVVALAIAGMLAAIAWSPLFRQDPLTIDLPAIQARAPGATFRAPAPAAFSLPAAWPDRRVRGVEVEEGASARPWWWRPPISETGAGWPRPDFGVSPVMPPPGPYSPLIVDHPDYGAAGPHTVGATMPAPTLGRE